MDQPIFSEIVRNYRKARGLSLRAFAVSLNEKLINTDISHATVALWESSDRYYEPELEFLFECLVTYTDWRKYFAGDCLRAVLSHVVGLGLLTINLPEANHPTAG